MPFADDPLWLDTLTYSGAEARRGDSMMLMANGAAGGSTGGIRPGDPGLLVTLSGMNISVAAGVAAVPYAGQGVYRAYNGTTWTGTVNTAHASLTRIDLVYLRVWDNAVDASGLAKADVVYLPGTAGSGVAPTPAGTQIYISLASINVPPGSTTPSATDLRPYAIAPGGIAPGGAVSGYYAGQYRDNPTTGALERWNGSAWLPYAQWLFARKTSDQSITSSTTYQTDTQLTLSLAANAVYTFEAFVVYSTPAAADFKQQWVIPSGATIQWSPWALSGDPSADTGSIRVISGNAVGFASTTGAPSTTLLAARPIGLVITSSTAGAFTYQWGQNTSDPATTAVHANSWLCARRVG